MTSQLPGWIGWSLMGGLGLVLLAVAVGMRRLASNTHDFITTGRGIGPASVSARSAVWTWSMAVLMSSAQAFTWGTSGLLWFIVPNSLAVIVMVRFAVRRRLQTPHGYRGERAPRASPEWSTFRIAQTSATKFSIFA